MKFLKGLLITVVAIIVLIVIVFIIGVNSESEPVQPEKELTAAEKIVQLEKKIQHQKDYTWFADNIYQQYEENSVKADEVFKGKVIYIKGTVKKIDKDIAGNPYIIIGNSKGMGTVQAMFDDDKIKQLSNLSKGNSVVLKGKIINRIMYVLVNDCELIDDVPTLKKQLKELKKQSK